MRTKFEEQLTQLHDKIMEMGAAVENAIADANNALMGQDVALAQRIIDSDDQIDIMEKEIESLCLKLILQQQPVAGDLRLVSAILKMTTDMERIGDHASDISEITIMLAGKPFIKKLEHIPQMAEETMKMVKKSIDAFVRSDIKTADEVIASDDIVDDLFETVKRDLIALIKENADNGDQAIDLIMIAKYFERIGDHATNLAEWVVFSLTGKHKKIKIM